MYDGYSLALTRNKPISFKFKGVETTLFPDQLEVDDNLIEIRFNEVMKSLQKLSNVSSENSIFFIVFYLIVFWAVAFFRIFVSLPTFIYVKKIFVIFLDVQSSVGYDSKKKCVFSRCCFRSWGRRIYSGK